MVSFVRAASLDIKHQAEYEEPTINIEELPEIDPWSTEGMALAKFERFKDLAQQAAEEEREAMAALMSMRKRIRAFALEHSCESGFSDHHLPEEMQTELQQLTEALELAQQKKQELSEQAQESRMEFNHVLLGGASAGLAASQA